MEIRTLSLWQPWASLIACGAKRYETRTWPPASSLIGRRIGVHAGLRVETAFDAETSRAVVLALGSPDWHLGVPRGAIMCTAILQGAYRLGEMRGGLARVVDIVDGSPPQRAVAIDGFGDYREGRWAWRLHQVVTLDPPLAVKGKQGWFFVRASGRSSSRSEARLAPNRSQKTQQHPESQAP